MQEKMKDLNEAYEVLSDKDKRWQYNQSFYQNEELISVQWQFRSFRMP